MMIDWPSRSLALSATSRPTKSVGPPGGKAITRRIGREASCAWSVVAEAAQTSSALADAASRDGTKSSRFMGPLWRALFATLTCRNPCGESPRPRLDPRKPRRYVSPALGLLMADDLPAHMRPEHSFQGLILALQRFWAAQGCVILQPYDMEVGAGTFHPA